MHLHLLEIEVKICQVNHSVLELLQTAQRTKTNSVNDEIFLKVAFTLSG